jgi:TonB family protein
MKREKKSGRLIMIGSLVLILVVTLFFACNKTGNTGAAAGDASSAHQARTDIPFVQVDEMPVFTGGDSALLNFIATNTTYPEEAKTKGISGKVIVRFVVEKDCTVSHVEVLRGVDPLLDAEAVKVVTSLPKFEKPAKNEGKVVSVFYMVPITFALK